MKKQKISLLFFFCTIYIQSVLCQPTSKPIYYFNPQFSPDGHSIAFESTKDGKSSIYTIAIDGTNLKKITDTIFNYGQPAWSPDGKSLIYYGSYRPMQLFTNSSKGGEQQQLATPGFDAYQPSWSVQNKIAFNSRAIGQTPNEIAVMNTDGIGFTKITPDEQYDYSSPKWSVDGKKILFQRSIAIRKPWKEITKEEMMQKKKSGVIMTMNSDGSNQRVLIPNLESEVAPFWSQDGNTIYYITKQDAIPCVYSMKSDQNEPELMLALSGIIYSASISPDGKYITYAAEREKKHAVYVMEIKKKTEVKLIGD